MPDIVSVQDKNGALNIDENTLRAMQFGFIGAYIYSIYLVYRRYTTSDLQPAVYMYCFLTMIAGIAFNFVAFTAISGLAEAEATQSATGLAGGVLAVVAFSLGYFPYLAIRWFNRIGHSALGMQQRRAEDLPLGLIDGISQFHESRLRDEGIDNVQNLASTALDQLLINTRFSAQQVVEWVDQAVLYLYLDLNEIDSFRRGGVRSFSDLYDLWKAYCPSSRPIEPEVDEDAVGSDERKNIALQFQSTPERLDALFKATQLGPNVAHIKKLLEKSG